LPAPAAPAPPPAPPLAAAPIGLPEMPVPPDNPLTPEKADLGRMLFFDTRLSDSARFSCASCHFAEKAWTDGEAFSTKADGQPNKRNTPTINIWLIGILAFVGAQFMSYQLTAEILNFGAFLGFIGVNAATFWQFYVVGQPTHKKNFFLDALVPGLGFIFCLIIWVGLGTPAKIAGGIWFAAGLIHSAIRTRGFRTRPAMIDFSES